MKIRTEVLSVLDRCSTTGNALLLPNEQLERKLYTDVAKVLELAGGKWNRKAKAILFDGDAADAIEPIILTGEITGMKQEFGQFDTPEELADRMAGLAGIAPGMKVLEPSCGIGRLVVAARKRGGNVWGYEIDPKRAAKCVDLFPSGGLVIGVDFMGIAPNCVFDVVLMNPPFTRRADIAHVLKALSFLKPGGSLISIMSAGVKFRSDKVTVAFRNEVFLRGGMMIDLPPDSFKESGTSVNAIIVVIPVTA